MSLVDQTKKERFLFIKIESTIINHGTGNLTLHFLETSNCDCNKFYNVEHDKLVRTSAAPSKLRSNVNFGSVDLLNEYLASLFGKKSGEKINCRINALNCDERDEVEEISKKRIYESFWNLHSRSTLWHWRCIWMQTGPWPRAPRELLNGEKEVDFEHKRKVHICDGIDTGNMQYATKGLVEKDLFRVPKVPLVCIFINHRNNIFDDSASTFLKILHQHFWRFFSLTYLAAL